MSEKKPRINLDSQLPNLTDEQKIDIAVRNLAGVSSSELAKEVGVSPNVIESWVERVGTIMDENADHSEDAQEQERVNALRAEFKRLKLQLEARQKQAELREVALKMVSKRPSFMCGN